MFVDAAVRNWFFTRNSSFGHWFVQLLILTLLWQLIMGKICGHECNDFCYISVSNQKNQICNMCWPAKKTYYLTKKKYNFVQKPRNKSSLGGFTGQKPHQCCNWNEKTGICSGFLFLSLIAKRCWNIDPSFISACMPWQMQVWTRVSRHMPGMQMLCTMRNTGCGYVQMRLTRVNIWSIYHRHRPFTTVERRKARTRQVAEISNSKECYTIGARRNSPIGLGVKPHTFSILSDFVLTFLHSSSILLRFSQSFSGHVSFSHFFPVLIDSS